MLAAPFCFPGWHGRGKIEGKLPFCRNRSSRHRLRDVARLWPCGQVRLGDSGTSSSHERTGETTHGPSQSTKHSMCLALRHRTWK